MVGAEAYSCTWGTRGPLKGAKVTTRTAEEVALDGIAQRAGNATVRLLDKTDPSGGGSAVLVLSRSKLFLASADHVIPKGHTIQIVGREGKPDITVSVYARNADEDIAILELPKGDYPDLRERAIELENLADKIDPSKAQNVLVIGYPADLIKPAAQYPLPNGDAVHVVTVSSVTFNTITPPVSEWPSKWFGRKLKPKKEFLISHEPEPVSKVFQRTRSRWRMSIGVGNPPPRPSGVSGGGVWLEHQLPGPVWKPSPLLVGLVVASGETDHHLLRAVRISSWLKLLAAKQRPPRRAGRVVRPNRQSDAQSISRKKPVSRPPRHR